MSLKIAAAAALLGLSLSSAAQAQGFSCSGRLTPDERMVCQGRTLARLDVQLNQIYERAIAQATPRGRSQLQTAQREWLQSRRACGSNRTCIGQLYRDQIAWLRQFV